MNGNKTATIVMFIGGGLLLVVSALILYFVFRSVPAGNTTQQEETGNPFSTVGSITSNRTGDGLALTLSDGSSISVPDFTKGEQPVWVSEYEYQVTGTPTGTYLITFLEPDQDNPQGEFLVTLLAEPLGETRIAAAAALKDQFSINDEELCKLDANVAAGPGVNDMYPPDLDLEFSGCPGAIELP